MKAKKLADKVVKAQYGKFRVSPNTCRCMEICVENLARMLYEQAEKAGRQYDLSCKGAIDVELYKIGRALKRKD